jgi:hypothetical protein
MSIKPVLVPDHDAAALRGLMDRFAEASTGPTRQQLAESRAAVAAAQGVSEGSAGWMLRQDPELAKKVRDNTQGYKDLKKMAGKPVPKKDEQGVAEQQLNEIDAIQLQHLQKFSERVSQMTPAELEALNQYIMGVGLGGMGVVAGTMGAYAFSDMFMSVMNRTMNLAKKKTQVDAEEVIKLQRQIISIHKRLKTLKSEPAIAKYQNMLKQAYEVLDELEARQDNKVAEQQVDEATGDLQFDTMLSKIVAGGNLQTLATKIVAKIKKFPQLRLPDDDRDGDEDWPDGYPDGHFYGADLWIDDSFDSILGKWKQMGPDQFADPDNEVGFIYVLEGSNDYTDNYWNGVLELFSRLEPIPGAQEQLAKMVWHGLFGGGVEQGTTDIGKPGVAEGKWNYPPEYTKKANADDEAELGVSLINKDARKAWRKKQKAKAHKELMTGKKKEPGVAEGLKDTIKKGVKNIKRGMQGWNDSDLAITGTENKPRDVANRAKNLSDKDLKDVHRAVNAPGVGIFGKGEYKNPAKHSPAGLQKHVLDREIRKRGLEEQGVAEAYDFKGGFPFDVDHMPGAVYRGGDSPVQSAKKKYSDHQQWEAAVNKMNSRQYDDSSEYTSDSKGQQVTADGHTWAAWNDTKGFGWIEAADMAEGKKRSDRYHIVGKDGNPASLASYADQASAVKDRDTKHPGGEVRQVGPRGKIKGVSENYDSAGAYDKWDPKHPDFVKNYRKFQASNPGASLADFVAHMKKGVSEGNPDVMRHTGDKTVRVVKKGGKPIGEIGIDAGPGGNGDYYVKLYDGSYDAAGFATAEEALAELKYAIKSAGSGPDTSFGGPSGWTGPVKEQQVDELSPKTLGSYIKKSSADAATRQGEVSGRNQFGKGAEFAVKAFYGDKIQPHPQRNDPKIAKRQAGVDQAVDRLTKEDMAESIDPVEQLRADIQRFAR